MAGTENEEVRFFFVGDDPSLDFVNTTAVLGGNVTDLLTDFDALVDWFVGAGLLDAASGVALKRQTVPADAERALAEARAFRSDLRRAAEAAADGKPIPDRAIRSINEQLRRGPRYTRLRGRDRTFERTLLPADAHTISSLLTPVAEAAATLLTDRDLARVRRCGNPNCILLFYDGSKNGRRRWCSMQVCGNRMKVAAHYHRQKKIGG